MSQNEIKEENTKNIDIEKKSDKTTNIINSINAIVIPNVEESFPDSKINGDFIGNSMRKEEEIVNKESDSSNNQIIKSDNYNQLNNKENIIQNNNINIIDNNNMNNLNINNSSNNNFNNNINGQISNNNNNYNKISHENNQYFINNNNNINLYPNQNPNINHLLNPNIYMNYSNSNSNTNQIQNNQNLNQTTNQNNTNQKLHQHINKNIIRKKSNAEKKGGQKGMKDFAFKFPLKQSFSKVEIPFAFQQNLDEPNNDSRFHSYITIKDTPKLYIDVSDDKKLDKFNLSSTIESLKATNQEQEKKLKVIDTNIMKFNNENDLLRGEIEKAKNELISRNNEINKLNQAIEQVTKNNNKYEKDFNIEINEKNNSYIELKEHYDKIRNEVTNKSLKENEKKECLMKIEEEINKIQKEYQNNLKYYNNKLLCNKVYSDEYIKKSLQKDLIDFTSYVSQKIHIISPKVKELINYIQNAVDASIGKEYEVRLYGSHATGLCLPWSDIDVVLCKKNGEGVENNSYLPLQELFTYLQKKNDLFKAINYIGTTTVPLIKIKTNENIGIQSVDISLQDKTHYGIKCVSLVLSFKKEYEVLLPMILALKNILKNANLNDPYKVRKISFFI